MDTLIQRKHNKVEGLWNEDKAWVSNDVELYSLTVAYFCKLYTDKLDSSEFSLPHGLFLVLDLEDLNGLRCTVDIREVKEALMVIGANKTPRPNGYHAFFF